MIIGKISVWCLFHCVILLQGSASAVKGDFLLSSEHLIEIITKLHRIGATAADREQLNIDISDEWELMQCKICGISCTTLVISKQKNASVWQVSGAVQAGQSLCEVRPGSAQERKQCFLQAQEQPPAGGVGAHYTVTCPPHSALQCCSRVVRSRAIKQNHHPLRNSGLPCARPEPKNDTVIWLIELFLCQSLYSPLL